MADKETKQAWPNLKERWGLLAELAAFILGVLGSFLLPPPGWVTSGGNQTLVGLARFIVAVLVGLIFLLAQKWNKKKHVRRWSILTIAAFVLSVSAFFGYQYLLDRRTCQYADQSVVIGTRYTDYARNYLRETPNSTCTSLLEDFAGKTEDIWTKQSINNSRYILAVTYILNLPLFTICLIAVVQALYCMTPKPQGRKKG